MKREYIDPLTRLQMRSQSFTVDELRDLRSHWTEELCWQYQNWRILECKRKAGRRYRRMSYYIHENRIKYAKLMLWGLWNIKPTT